MNNIINILYVLIVSFGFGFCAFGIYVSVELQAFVIAVIIPCFIVIGFGCLIGYVWTRFFCKY